MHLGLNFISVFVSHHDGDHVLLGIDVRCGLVDAVLLTLEATISGQISNNFVAVPAADGLAIC